MQEALGMATFSPQRVHSLPECLRLGRTDLLVSKPSSHCLDVFSFFLGGVRPPVCNHRWLAAQPWLSAAAQPPCAWRRRWCRLAPPRRAAPGLLSALGPCAGCCKMLSRRPSHRQVPPRPRPAATATGCPKALPQRAQHHSSRPAGSITAMRLVNGSSTQEGRLEVQLNGTTW